MADNLKSELLGLFAFAVVLADKRLKTLGQTAETNGEGRMFQHVLNAVVSPQLFAVHPNTLSHEERIVVHMLFLNNGQACQDIVMADFDVLVKQLPELVHIALGL